MKHTPSLYHRAHSFYGYNVKDFKMRFAYSFWFFFLFFFECAIGWYAMCIGSLHVMFLSKFSARCLISLSLDSLNERYDMFRYMCTVCCFSVDDCSFSQFGGDLELLFLPLFLVYSMHTITYISSISTILRLWLLCTTASGVIT